MNNPYISALAAMSYIGGLMLLLLPVLEYLDRGGDVEVFAPFIILSLLVLSVATMAFLFFYQPLLFIIDRKHKEAVGYFARVVGTFAVGTVVIIALAGFVKFTVIANDVYCEDTTGAWVPCSTLESLDDAAVGN